ncbi:uncharacterized protein BP01DRAFT_384436 [Aspergillus saccharolyticus JOP 1030-1]|uniref:MFS general substrate transporter n=1 Tax=Aspergillus saccharolyticus JOP 1030-1 TaxID=1450539 RepID=A0A318ZFW0_9EURO|nr:hypothetical protein BP01DRAFT_384436 [Aspergillus saccharolyticus JOP 1030-1]PYH43503.1 hypothetical protein BP01DRAFT_384436 [Aspergillus saccharolyticus JOP 1030-1]
MPSHSYTFHITTTLLAAEFTGSAIATFALHYSVYVSLLLGLILLIVTLPLALLIPSDERAVTSRQRPADGHTEQHELTTWATSCLKQLRKPKVPSRPELRVSWLVATCLISRIGRYPFSVLLPTLSHRYQGTMTETGVFLCLNAGVSLIGIAFLLHGIRPFFSRQQSPTHSADATPLFGPYRFDLWTMRGSAMCMAIGAVLVSSSRTLTMGYAGVVLYALGIGFGGGVGRLIAQLTESEGVLLPNNMLEAVFDAIAAPAMSYTCLIGAQLDESMSMVGQLSFVAAASIFGMIAIGSFIVGGGK